MSIEERAESIMLCLNNVCNTGYTLQKCDYDFIDKQIDEIKKEATDVQPAVHGKWDTHDVVKVLCSGKTLTDSASAKHAAMCFRLHIRNIITALNAAQEWTVIPNEQYKHLQNVHMV